MLCLIKHTENARDKYNHVGLKQTGLVCLLYLEVLYCCRENNIAIAVSASSLFRTVSCNLLMECPSTVCNMK